MEQQQSGGVPPEGNEGKAENKGVEAIEAQEGQQEEKKNSGVLIAVIVLAVIFMGMFFFSGNKNESESGGASISGTVNYNGLKPTGENKVEGKVILMQREFGTEEFWQVDTQIAFTDEAEWEWDGAKEGMTYDLKIGLFLRDKPVKESNTVTTTAPSSNQTLTLQVTLEDIPQEIVDTTDVSISGTMDINGYVPTGSDVTIFQKPVGTEDTAYEATVEGVEAKDGETWSWDKARAGVEYDLKATIYYGGQIIGDSEMITVVAPAKGEVIRVQSKAKDPSEEVPATISGMFYISGPVAEGSDVAVYQKRYGAEYTTFEEFQRIPAVNGTPWEWEGALEATKYEIQAVLMVGGEMGPYSNQVLVTAPAFDETLKLDTLLSLESPKEKPTVKCGSMDNAGGYNATVTFERVDQATNYSLEVGAKPGERDTAHDIREQTTKSDPELEAYVKAGKTYYARYAYSGCSACDITDRLNWSGYSPTLGFVCGEK